MLCELLETDVCFGWCHGPGDESLFPSKRQSFLYTNTTKVVRKFINVYTISKDSKIALLQSLDINVSPQTTSRVPSRFGVWDSIPVTPILARS